MGQLDCYERASEMAEFLLNVKTNDTAIYRLTDQIGELSKALLIDHDFRQSIPIEAQEYLYLQCDGSMLVTREEKWKEVKSGRVFKSSSILPQSADRQWIRESEYLGHYGNHKGFENKMSMLIDDTYKTKIAQDGYKKTLARIVKNKGAEAAMRYIDKIPRNTDKKKIEYAKLLTDMNNNKHMMDYPSYIEKAYLIGSGVIESAHRTVLQKRMKQSGQRWSIKGLQNMINLRVLYMSGYKEKVRDLIINQAT